MPGDSSTVKFDGRQCLTSSLKSQSGVGCLLSLTPSGGVSTALDSANWMLPSGTLSLGEVTQRSGGQLRTHSDSSRRILWLVLVAAAVLHGHRGSQWSGCSSGRSWDLGCGLGHLGSFAISLPFFLFLIFFLKFLFSLSHSDLVSIVCNQELCVAAVCPQRQSSGISEPFHFLPNTPIQMLGVIWLWFVPVSVCQYWLGIPGGIHLALASFPQTSPLVVLMIIRHLSVTTIRKL